MTGSREAGTELNGRNPEKLFAKPDVRVTRRANGTMVLSAAEPLGRYGRSMNEHLVDWAHRAPQRPFLLENLATTLPRGYSRLDPDLPKDGLSNSKWGLILNVSPEELLNAVSH